jgi:tRNA A-37 threonylcarbamoyl transferase component Bud32
MSLNRESNELIAPPAYAVERQRDDWLPISKSDPVISYIVKHHWAQPKSPVSWEAARLSSAAFVYRETSTRWAVVAKFYTVKMGEKARRYARREFESTQRARETGLAEARVRAVRPLANWRGVLLLEYIDGLTLEDVIAIRRSRPGTLAPNLDAVVGLLGTLHRHSPQPGIAPDAQSPVRDARETVGDLVRWGVLESDPVICDGLHRALHRWARRLRDAQFVPTLTHGDATTTNFIFPWGGGVVAVDWERLYVADPASDLGRLMAEVSHSVKQHGGSVAEALPYVERLAEAYSDALMDSEDAAALLERARFYQASSTLRIARNGWVSRLDRTALIAQALALLNS